MTVIKACNKPTDITDTHHETRKKRPIHRNDAQTTDDKHTKRVGALTHITQALDQIAHRTPKTHMHHTQESPLCMHALHVIATAAESTNTVIQLAQTHVRNRHAHKYPIRQTLGQKMGP
jgi:hypothetical protein